MKRLDVNELYKNYKKVVDKEEGSDIYLNTIGSDIYGTYIGSKAYIDLLARIWDENVHFYEGDHYLYYNDILGQYQNRPVTKFNRFIPRSVTNYIFPIVNTMVSLLTKNKPDAKVIPNSNDSQDVNRAKLADAILQAKWEMDLEGFKLMMAAKLAVLTGTVYRKDYWDVTGLETVELPGEEKSINSKAIAAGMKEEKGEHPELPEEELKQLVLDHLKEDKNYYGEFEPKEKEGKEEANDDKENAKQTKNKDYKYQEENIKLPLGDNKVSILSVFEIIPDIQNAVQSLDDGEFILECTLHPISWIKDTYNQDLPGYTGLAKEVKEDENLSLQLTYFERLKGSTGKSGQYGQQPDLKGQAVLIEAYIKPCKDFEKGLMVVVCNGKVLYINSSPYTFGNGKNWHPYTMFRWDLHPLRHHGISLVEQQVPIQKRVNAIDNLVILNRMTMATPQWKIPTGCLMPGGYISGEPGLNIYYNPAVGEPHKVEGRGLDPSVYKEKEEAVMNLHVIAGDNEVMQGLRPMGVNTAAGLNMLIEQSYSKFSPLVQEWERFIECGQTKKLNVIRRFYKEPRAELINKLKQMNSDTTSVQIDDFFTGKDLGDNLDVRVEAGSSLPRSSVVHQNNIKELLPFGVFGAVDPLSNPEANRKLLQEFGISDFPTATGRDTERAKWENDLLRQGKFEEVEVLPMDNPIIHWNIVTEEMKRPEFWQNNDEDVIARYVIHAIYHYLDMSPEQIKMAGITLLQEKQIVEMGVPLINIMSPLRKAALEEKMATFVPQPAQAPIPPIPQEQVAAGLPVENLSPASPMGNSSSDLLPSSPEVALNTQGVSV